MLLEFTCQETDADISKYSFLGSSLSGVSPIGVLSNSLSVISLRVFAAFLEHEVVR